MSNTFRNTYRELTPQEKQRLDSLKYTAQSLLDLFPTKSREAALAKTKLEEAVMWAVKGISG